MGKEQIEWPEEHITDEEYEQQLRDWEDEYDGQPTEYDEWMDFDPDC